MAVLPTALLVCSLASSARTLHVGPGRDFERIGDAIRRAEAGSVIQVDAGTYPGDVALIDRNDVSIRARGGRVSVPAAGRAIEGKGIWVVRAERVLVEGIDFSDAAVPDRNGAGIRFDRGSLTVRDCGFFRNQAGLLTGNDPASSLVVENSEFAGNGYGDGQSHQLYAGKIASIRVQGSYFHQANEGQLIKSRAADSAILYNRLTDELGGRASYELEFPNGGHALVVGNIIQQSATTQNRTMISFGVEGYAWPHNLLLLSHNTLVDQRPMLGRYLFVKAGPARAIAVNNLLVGGSRQLEAENLQASANAHVGWTELALTEPYDYRLRENAKLTATAAPSNVPSDAAMIPQREYVHPRGTRPLAGPVRHPGALQQGLSP